MTNNSDKPAKSPGNEGAGGNRQDSPTLEHVAAHAGVSTATVSRALNQPDKVVDSTRRRIEAAIEELGYTPHFGARYLASNRSNTVGAIIPTMANAMFASGLQAFQEELSESGYTLLVASSGYDAESSAASNFCNAAKYRSCFAGVPVNSYLKTLKLHHRKCHWSRASTIPKPVTS